MCILTSCLFFHPLLFCAGSCTECNERVHRENKLCEAGLLNNERTATQTAPTAPAPTAPAPAALLRLQGLLVSEARQMSEATGATTWGQR